MTVQRTENKKFHYTYKVLRFDGKYYLGMHSTNNLDDGYLGSGRLISRSIKKYGKAKHSLEILEYANSRQDLKNLEIALISEDKLKDALCLNLAPGGEGGAIRFGAHTEETKKKISEASKRRTQEQKDKISKKYSDVAKLRTKEQKANFIAALKNKSQVTIEKMRASATGKKASDETRSKIALNSRNISQETRKKLVDAATGKKVSDETRSKISQAHLGKLKSEMARRNMAQAQLRRAILLKDANGGKHPFEPSNSRQVKSPQGQLFKSVAEAVRLSKISKSKITALLKDPSSKWEYLL